MFGKDIPHSPLALHRNAFFEEWDFYAVQKPMFIGGSNGVFGVSNGYGERHRDVFAHAVRVFIRTRFLLCKRNNAVAVGEFMGKAVIVFYQLLDNAFDL